MLIKLPEKQNKSTDHVLNFMYGHLGSDFINDISCEDVVFGNIGHSGYPVDKTFLKMANNPLLLEEYESHEKNKTSPISITPSPTPSTTLSSSWWKHLVAGGTAGMVSRTCTAPLDRIKITLQVHQMRHKNISSTISYMLKEGGVLSFWRGNGVNILKVVPEMAVKFTVYDQTKNSIRQRKGTTDLTISDRFVSGSIAGVISQSVVFPLEVMKTRMVLRQTSQSPWSCVQDLFTNNRKLRACFRGFLPNIMGIIPYAGIDLAVYETLKREYTSRQSIAAEAPIVVFLVCGVVSSTCGQLVSYPLNLVKTRFQAQPVAISPALSVSGMLWGIVSSEGLTGLYRGLGANLLKVAPSIAIGYVVYEHTRSSLGAVMT